MHPLPVLFMSQFFAGEGLARVTRYLSAVACHVSNRRGLPARSCDSRRGCSRCVAGRSVATKGKLPHRTNTQVPGRELPCTIESLAKSGIFGTVSGEHRQQSLDACDCPEDQLLAVFLGQGQIGRVRFHVLSIADGSQLTIRSGSPTLYGTALALTRAVEFQGLEVSRLGVR